MVQMVLSTTTGPIFHLNDTKKDRRGHHLGYILAIVQRALSLIQADRLVEDRDFQRKRQTREEKYQTKPQI